MIKSEIIERHTLLCPHCGGNLTTRNKIAKNEFSSLYSNDDYGFGHNFYFKRTEYNTPKCIKCNREFEVSVKFDVYDSIVVEIKEKIN